jgi:seryl-tRNA synthetase
VTTAAKKHRLQDQNAALSAENKRLKAEAGKLAESVWRGIQDAGALKDAYARINELTDANTALQRHVDDLTAENDQLAADLANARAVRVPAGVRDTSDPADQATAPWGTNVREVRDRFEHGPVVRLGASPHADTVQMPITDPAHIPGAA